MSFFYYFFHISVVHQAARKTIAMAEERFLTSDSHERRFDSAWQEMLNHATIKVKLATREIYK